MQLRWMRDPLLVFALAGAALFGLHAAVDAGRRPQIVLAASTRAALIENFELLTGKSASDEDIARIERDYIADELLLRDAADAGLHLSDADIRAELIQARRLEITGVLPDPTDEQLVNHYAEHRDRYHSEPTLSFEQVYFQAPPADSAALLARLRAGEVVAGDAYWQGSSFPDYGQSILRGMFGQPLVEALWAAPLGEWSGPVESPRGWHYLRPSARKPGALLAFAAVRDQVESDYLGASIQQAVDQHVDTLKGRYEVAVER